MSIDIRNVSKSFSGKKILHNIDLTVPSGQLVALLGPSGCGKTSLLRIIAGLEEPDAGSGEIRFHDESVAKRQAKERGVGFVFQHYALFRHMSVFNNVAFGLQVKPKCERPDGATIRRKVMDLLQLVQLDSYAEHYPAQLSGGQRQRVALARALAVEPKVLLLDEPFGALDAKVRVELRRWLRRLHDEIHVTSVFVTHDQEEAMEVADRVVVMNAGCIEQVGTPQEVWDQPANPFVYNFLGSVNLFHGRAHPGHAHFDGIKVTLPDELRREGEEVVGYVRPYDIELSRVAAGEETIAATVRAILGAGALIRVEVERLDGGGTLEVVLTRERCRELNPQVGDQLYARATHIRVFTETKALDYQI